MCNIDPQQGACTGKTDWRDDMEGGQTLLQQLYKLSSVGAYVRKHNNCNHGLSRRYDWSHQHEWNLSLARSPICERHIQWQIWHSKLLVDGGPDLHRSRWPPTPECIVLQTLLQLTCMWNANQFYPLQYNSPSYLYIRMKMKKTSNYCITH